MTLNDLKQITKLCKFLFSELGELETFISAIHAIIL